MSLKKLTIGRKLRMLGIPKSFFTKPQNKTRIKYYQDIMWYARKHKIIDFQSWNEAALVYGYIPLWIESEKVEIPDITIGADQEVE